MNVQIFMQLIFEENHEQAEKNGACRRNGGAPTPPTAS